MSALQNLYGARVYQNIFHHCFWTGLVRVDASSVQQQELEFYRPSMETIYSWKHDQYLFLIDQLRFEAVLLDGLRFRFHICEHFQNCFLLWVMLAQIHRRFAPRGQSMPICSVLKQKPYDVKVDLKVLGCQLLLDRAEHHKQGVLLLLVHDRIYVSPIFD
jgi:hypothetical protein